jgi:hypothetical protein
MSELTAAQRRRIIGDLKAWDDSPSRRPDYFEQFSDAELRQQWYAHRDRARVAAEEAPKARRA